MVVQLAGPPKRSSETVDQIIAENAGIVERAAIDIDP